MKDLTAGSTNNSPLDQEMRQYALRALPKHWVDAGEWEELLTLLTNFAFMEEKVTTYGPNSLIEDYEKVDDNYPLKNLFRSIRWALMDGAHYLREQPEIIAQCVHNNLLKEAEKNSELQKILTKAVTYQKMYNRAWFRLLPSSPTKPSREAKPLLLSNNGRFRKIVLHPQRSLAAVTSDEGISFWNTENAIQLANLNQPNVIGVAWFRDGKRLLSATNEGVICIWDLNTYEQIQTWNLRENPHTVTLSSNGSVLILISTSHIIAWDIEAQRLRSRREISGINAAVVLNDGRSALLAGGWPSTRALRNKMDAFLAKWDLISDTLIELLILNACGELLSIAIDASEHLVACGDPYGSIIVFDLYTESLQSIFPGDELNRRFDYHMKVGKEANFHPSHHEFESLISISSPTKAHNNQVSCLAFSDNGLVLASGSGKTYSGNSAPGETLLWNLEHRELQSKHTYADSLDSIAFLGSSYLMVAGVNQLSITSIQEPRSSMSSSSESQIQYVGCASISFDGSKKALTYGADILIEHSNGEKSQILSAHTGVIRCIDWSHKEDIFATSGDDGYCRVWDAITTKQIHEIMCKNSKIASLRFSADGSLLALVQKNGICRVVSLNDGHERKFQTKKPWHLTNKPWPLTCVAISDTGLIAVGCTKTTTAVSYQAAVYLWELKSGKLLSILNSFNGPIVDLDFTHDGFLVVASRDQSCSIWNTHDYKEIIRYQTNGDQIKLCSHPTMSVLITSSSDRTCRLWHRKSNKALACLPMEDWISDMSIRGDSNELVLLDIRGRVFFYSLLKEEENVF